MTEKHMSHVSQDVPKVKVQTCARPSRPRLPKVPCQRVDRVLQLQCLGYSILGAANRDRCLCCLAGSEVLPGFGERSVSEGDALADLLGVVSNGRNGVRVKRCLEVRERAFSAGYAG